VVHVTGDNRHGRYVTEVVAPSVEEDGARFVVHRVLAPRSGAPDARARPASEPQRWMLDRLALADPDFNGSWWHSGADTHRPMRAGELLAVAS
jgi:hypothetical protein